MANAVVQTNSVVGYHSIINTSAVVEHDTVNSDYSREQKEPSSVEANNVIVNKPIKSVVTKGEFH